MTQAATAEHLPFELFIQCKMCGAEYVCQNPTATVEVIEDGEGGSGYLVLFGMPIRCPGCCLPYMRRVDSEASTEDEPA